jgi:hypothetical protein
MLLIAGWSALSSQLTPILIVIPEAPALAIGRGFFFLEPSS